MITSTARASSVFLSSYRNTVLNQSACVFALGYFLKHNDIQVDVYIAMMACVLNKHMY